MKSKIYIIAATAIVSIGLTIGAMVHAQVVAIPQPTFTPLTANTDGNYLDNPVAVAVSVTQYATTTPKEIEQEIQADDKQIAWFEARDVTLEAELSSVTSAAQQDVPAAQQAQFHQTITP